MSAALAIELEIEAPERVAADVVMVGIAEGDRPLRAAAGRADWRLCGQLSRLLIDRHFSGRLGEALLVPTAGRLAAPRLLALGLGPRAQYRSSVVRAVHFDALVRCGELRARRVACAPLGIESDDFCRHAQPFLSAAVDAVRQLAAPLSIRLALAEAEISPAILALAQAWRGMRDPDFNLSLPDSAQWAKRLSARSAGRVRPPRDFAAPPGP